jgi:hypothetical protein
MRVQLRRRAWLCALACACTPAGGVDFEPSPGTGGGGGTSESSGSSGDGGGEEPPPPPPPPSSSGTGGDDSGGPVNGANLIPAHASWRFVDPATPVAGEWVALEFDDSTWSEGQAPFGDDASAATPATAQLGLRLRRHFTAAAQDATLKLFLRRGDGAAVYLNGAPLVRSNLAADPRPDGAGATVDLTGNEPLRYIQLAAPATLLDGDNVIAVEVRRAGPGAPGLHFDLQLDVWDLSAAPAEMSAQIRTISYGGEYASDNAAVAWIERDGVGVVRTLAVWAEVRREHLVRWRAASSGDITDAVTAATRGRHGTLDLKWDLHDAAGQAAPAGAYRLMVEFTEDDSNKGAPAGPAIAVPFELGGGPHVAMTPDQARFADVLIVSP